MPKSKVYFYDDTNDFTRGLNTFFEMIAQEIEPKERIGIKIHFGAEHNDTHINPAFLQDITNYFEQPVFVECNCLYPGRRHRSDEHIRLAKEHGFDFLEIDILDGDEGRDMVEIEIDTKNTKIAKLGKGIERYPNLISLAHFKGHIAAGFGGALKNLAMGIGSRAGKLDMHAGVSPKVNEEKCTACGTCVENCPVMAIGMEETAKIDQEKCIGCAYCIAICPEKAIRVPFGARTGKEFLEKLAEYAFAATKKNNWWYINVINNITMKCDCMRIKQTPFMDDIGIVFSKDPIAIDKASLDLVTKHNNGKNPFANNNEACEHIFQYGEELGLGTTEYLLVPIATPK
jgi:hypothetical protein